MHLKRFRAVLASWTRRRAAFVALSTACAVVLGCSPNDPLEEVRRLQASGRLEESLEPLRNLLDSAPDSSEVHYRYGLALTRTGRPGMAVWSLRRAKDDPAWAVPASLELARAALGSGNWSNAIEASSSVLEDDPENVEALEMRAEAYMGQLTEPEKALEDLDRAKEIAPDSAGLRSARVRALIMNDKIDEAAEALADLERMDPESGNVAPHLRGPICVLRGVFERERGNLEKAEEVMSRCLAEHPADGTVVDAAVEFYDGRREADEATRIIRTALEQVPTSLRYRTLLANRLRASGKIADAEAVLREGLRPDSPETTESIWVALANHFAEIGDDLAAADAYGKVIEGSPQVSELGWFTYADLLAAADRNDQALEISKRIQAAHYRKLIEARVDLNRDRPQEALELFDEVMPLWPNNAGARYFAARASEQVGKLERAIEEYRQSIRSDAASTDAGLRLAQLLRAMGDLRGAWVACNHHLEAQPGDRAGQLLMMSLAIPHGPDAVRSQLQRASGTRFWPDAVAIHLDAVARRAGPERAVERFEEFKLDLSQPANAAALRSVVRHWMAAGDSDAARSAVEAALKAHPDEARFHSVAGLVRELAGGGPSAGRAEYTRAIELDPREAWALEALGRIAVEDGKIAEAVDAFDRAARAAGDDPGPGLQAARLLSRPGSPGDVAEARWRSLAKAFPWEVEPLRELALRSLARSDSDVALDYAQRALRMGGGAEEWTLLATIHEQRGDKKKAEEARARVRPGASAPTPPPGGDSSGDSAESGQNS